MIIHSIMMNFDDFDDHMMIMDYIYIYICMYRVYPQMATFIGKNDHNISSYWCVLRRECSRMIHFITSNNHPSNPQSYPFPTFSTSKISK